jgi:hypothetical protein
MPDPHHLTSLATTLAIPNKTVHPDKKRSIINQRAQHRHQTAKNATNLKPATNRNRYLALTRARARARAPATDSIHKKNLRMENSFGNDPHR